MNFLHIFICSTHNTSIFSKQTLLIFAVKVKACSPRVAKTFVCVYGRRKTSYLRERESYYTKLVSQKVNYLMFYDEFVFA